MPSTKSIVPGFMQKLFNTDFLAPLWRFSHWAYSEASALFLVDRGTLFDTLWSRDGAQQGDVIAGLLFALGNHDVSIVSTLRQMYLVLLSWMTFIFKVPGLKP